MASELKKSLTLGALFCFLSMLWGGSFVAIKHTIGVIDSYWAAFLRLLIASLALVVIYSFLGKQFFVPRAYRMRIWLTGVLSIGIPFALLFWGEKSVSAGTAGMINGSVPLWTSLLIFFFMGADEKQDLHFKSVIGLSLGFIGVCAIFYPLVQSTSGESLWGGLAILGMSLCYAFGNIFNRSFLKKNDISISASVFQQHLSSTFFLLIAASVLGSPFVDLAQKLNWSVFYSLLYLGIGSTALALIIYFYLLRQMGSMKTSAVAYLIPVFAIFFDALIFGSFPTLIALIGIGLVLLGVFFIRSQSKAAVNKISPHGNKG